MKSFNSNLVFGVNAPVHQPIKGHVVYRNLTGNNLDQLKQIVTDDLASLKILKAQYDNANAWLSWMYDFTTYCQTKATTPCWAKPISALSTTEMEDGAKAAFAAIGVTGATTVSNMRAAVNDSLSVWSSKITAAQNKLQADQKTYNDALEVAGKSDPDTINAVAEAQASVTSSNIKKWVTISAIGLGLVAGGIGLWALIRSIKAKKVKAA